MRRWLLVLLVLLLPLRGWVGEAMAGEMLHEHLAATAGAHVHAAPGFDHLGVHAEHGADHHGHESAKAGSSPSPFSDCGTCAACQACSSVGLPATLPVIAAGGFSQPRPQSIQRTYTSAEPLLAFKPPRA